MKYIYVVIAIVFPVILSARNVQFDKRAIEQVGKNSAAALSAENLIKKSMEKAKKAQETINKYTTIVQANLSMIQKSQQDVSDFKAGVKSMEILTRTLGLTLSELNRLRRDMVRYPKGTLVYHSSFSTLYQETIGIGSKVISLVTDGNEQIGKIPAVQISQNLLSPTKRLEILDQCIYELERVYTMARQIRIGIMMRNTTQEVALEFTPSAVLSADMLKQIKEDVIQLWQSSN